MKASNQKQNQTCNLSVDAIFRTMASTMASWTPSSLQLRIALNCRSFKAAQARAKLTKLRIIQFHIRPTTDDRYLILRGSGDCFVIIYRYTNIGISETEPC
ncbi:hypothetical protein YC2023_022376 [Brassica napus]